MAPTLILPLLVALVLAVAMTALHRRLPPALAARTVSITLVVTAAASVPTVWIIGLDYLAHAEFLGGRFAWCATPVMSAQRIPTLIGLPAAVLAAVGTVRAVKVLRVHRGLRQHGLGSLEVADHDEAFAFTLPGRAGRVLLSRGMIELLDPREHAVVLAHEHAHARYRHDRYLLTGQMAAAVVPVLRPLATRLHFSLERWADEVAVAQCGDRRFVARTLGKVALSNSSPDGALSFTGLGVPGRVAALLAPPPASPRLPHRVGLWSALVVTGGLGAIQIHHLIGVFSSLCLG